MLYFTLKIYEDIIKQENKRTKHIKNLWSFCKIDCEGPCGPTPMGVTPLFLYFREDLNNTKNFVDCPILKNDFIYISQC